MKHSTFVALAIVVTTALIALPGFAEEADSATTDAAAKAAANANNPLANMVSFNMQFL
jgi:hypothetical protein